MFTSEIEFHAVGQGLFSSGCISKENHRPFWWIYDCGTSSKKYFLHREIESLREKTDTINLAFISHFDNDHINGLLKLLTNFNVKRLVLPYISLWKRMVLAFDKKAQSGSDLMELLISPESFIRTRGQQPNTELIFVLAKEDSSDGKLEDYHNGEMDDETLPLTFHHQPPPEGVDQRSAPGETKPYFLPHGKSINLNSIWEFLPYNSCELKKRAPYKFKNEVKLFGKGLLVDPNKTNLARIKNSYNTWFGNSPKAKNLISMFLYSSPLNVGQYQGSSKLAMLYTGDGYLDNQKRVSELLSFLGNKRSASIFFLQVMHHGAKCSWMPGLADRIDPAVSIFCSNPEDGRYRHPHKEVYSDFSSRFPVQVTTDTNLLIIMWLS